MAFYIDGVEATIDEKLNAFGDRLDKVETGIETLKHLLIGSLVLPVLVGVFIAAFMKWTTHA